MKQIAEKFYDYFNPETFVPLLPKSLQEFYWESPLLNYAIRHIIYYKLKYYSDIKFITSYSLD